MRSTFVRFALAAFVATATFVGTRDARAEEQFDVSVAGGTVTVTTKGGWHINKEYKWKLDAQQGFALTETEAKLANASKGKHMLKGAVCSGATCLPFSKEVTVQ